MTMHKSKLTTLVVSILLASPALAAEEKIVGEFGWFGVGTAHQIEEGHFYWVGEFSGTFFNDKGEGSMFHRAGVKCPAYFDADFRTNKSVAGGYCVITDTDGDQAYLKWHNKGDPRPTGHGPGTWHYTGGTGKYEGINTEAVYTFDGVTQINWADGTSTGYATWNR